MTAAQNFWKSRHAVGFWLLAIALVILGMVTIGGLTRLTGSVLSITEWKPIMGAIPPLNQAEWQDAFTRYQRIPQYLVENRGMSLEAFKGIFWWEWIHRFLGRLLGVLFFVPFVWFAATGAIQKRDWPRMLILFLLGGLQGFIGWWMVTSGFEVRTSVSQYRLAIHLGAALLLLVAILWIALEYLRGAPEKGDAKRGIAFVALVYVQMLLGALVAGLHAGLIYNSWPDMNGRVLPEDAFFSAPWWINFFENPGLAQFDHRIGAYIVAAAAIFVWWSAMRAKVTGAARTSAYAILIITFAQIALGITTLLNQAPILLSA